MPHDHYLIQDLTTSVNWLSRLASIWLKWANFFYQQRHLWLQVPSVTLVMKPCPQTLWGRGRPQDMSMPGQYTAWKRRMSLPMMWLPGHPCCFRLSAVGSTPSGNRPGQYNYCSCTGADSCEQVSKQGLLTWALPCGVVAGLCILLQVVCH